MLEWRTLFSEDLKTLSLGRIAFWIALSYSTWFWFISTGIFPSALLEFLYATLGYNLGTKGVRAYQTAKTAPYLPQLTPEQTKIILKQDDITDEDLKRTK